MLTEVELRTLARMIVQEQAENEQWMMAYAKAQSKIAKPEKKLISPQKAADMIGISVWQLYRIKDDENGIPNFSYVKAGKSKSSPLKFNAATLIEEYERFLAKKQKIVRLEPIRKAMAL